MSNWQHNNLCPSDNKIMFIVYIYQVTQQLWIDIAVCITHSKVKCLLPRRCPSRIPFAVKSNFHKIRTFDEDMLARLVLLQNWLKPTTLLEFGRMPKCYWFYWSLTFYTMQMGPGHAQGSVHAILTFLSSALPLPPLLEAMFSEVTIILVFTLVVLDYDYPIIIIIIIIIIVSS